MPEMTDMVEMAETKQMMEMMEVMNMVGMIDTAGMTELSEKTEMAETVAHKLARRQRSSRDMSRRAVLCRHHRSVCGNQSQPRRRIATCHDRSGRCGIGCPQAVGAVMAEEMVSVVASSMSTAGDAHPLQLSHVKSLSHRGACQPAIRAPPSSQ